MQKSSKRNNPLITLFLFILALSAMPASAGVCTNQSLYTTYTGIGTGGTYDSTGFQGPIQLIGRYSFSPSTANTTTGTVNVTGYILDGFGVRQPITSLNGSYSVNASTCYVSVSYKMYTSGTFLATVTTAFSMGSMTNPAAPGANLAYTLDGLEMINIGTYHLQWTTELKRVYK